MPEQTMQEDLLRKAICLSVEKMRAGEGGPFGAVIVRQGEVVGTGWNRVPSTNDPTAHAEVEAIRDACRRLETFSLAGCDIYVNCEPCPMCLGAIYWARLDGIYYAATREDAAAIGFDDALIYRELALSPDERRLKSDQLLRDEAAEAMRGWLEKADRTEY